jgi:hypothetical protein
MTEQTTPAVERPRTWTILYDDYEKGTAFLTDDPREAQEAIAGGLSYEVAETIAVKHNEALAAERRAVVERISNHTFGVLVRDGVNYIRLGELLDVLHEARQEAR